MFVTTNFLKAVFFVVFLFLASGLAVKLHPLASFRKPLLFVFSGFCFIVMRYLFWCH
jgi:hypothetical protein